MCQVTPRGNDLRALTEGLQVMAVRATPNWLDCDQRLPAYPQDAGNLGQHGIEIQDMLEGAERQHQVKAVR